MIFKRSGAYPLKKGITSASAESITTQAENSATPATTVLLTSEAGTSTSGAADLDINSGSTTANSKRSEVPAASKGSFFALIVPPNNANAAKNVRYAKIAWKKLATSQLQQELVTAVGMVLPSTPSTININGLFYVRRTCENSSTLIYSTKDLNNFLGGPPTTET